MKIGAVVREPRFGVGSRIGVSTAGDRVSVGDWRVEVCHIGGRIASGPRRDACIGACSHSKF